jgi:hypothetical protein
MPVNPIAEDVVVGGVVVLVDASSLAATTGMGAGVNQSIWVVVIGVGGDGLG